MYAPHMRVVPTNESFTSASIPWEGSTKRTEVRRVLRTSIFEQSPGIFRSLSLF